MCFGLIGELLLRWKYSSATRGADRVFLFFFFLFYVGSVDGVAGRSQILGLVFLEYLVLFQGNGDDNGDDGAENYDRW